jgi:hypothetical protein
VQAGYVCAVSIAEPMSSSAGAGYESSKSVHDTPHLSRQLSLLVWPVLVFLAWL